jgi:hypothetical protein
MLLSNPPLESPARQARLAEAGLNEAAIAAEVADVGFEVM